jgi:hypothetical protein
MRNDEFYVQDNWRVSKRLTIDTGMRFCHRTVPAQAVGQPPYDPKKAPVMYRPGFDAHGKRAAINPKTGAVGSKANIGRLIPGIGDPFIGTVVGRDSPLAPPGIEILPKRREQIDREVFRLVPELSVDTVRLSANFYAVVSGTSGSLKYHFSITTGIRPCERWPRSKCNCFGGEAPGFALQGALRFERMPSRRR